ncbi:hypothetical protein LTR04_003508 [Oleoguttula sp. CCFEE 6159]|nr:hypothetical protein LTR04_003508 [Oleoguttula sp. CCFEE 6159]
MRWYYLHNFTRYRASLEALRIHMIDKHDLIGLDDSARKSTLMSGSRSATAPHDAFSLGRRMELLRTTSNAALSSYLAEEDKSSHHLEVPFRAFNLALVDNASAEYSFITEFFSKQSFHAVNRKFAEIFEPTFALGQALTKQLVDTTVDALGVLICVRLNQHFAFELQRRKMIMDMHCESMRRAASSLSGRSAVSALSLTSSPNAQSTAPHQLTQKFANFLQGILALSSEAGDDEPVSNSLGRLRGDFEAFLTKMSKSIGDSKKRERFLFNNYSLVGTIIGETEGKLAEEQKSHFNSLKEAFAEKR